jgi:hypothetical protein
VRFLFSEDRRNRLVHTNDLTPVATDGFTDAFAERALRLSAMLHN